MFGFGRKKSENRSYSSIITNALESAISDQSTGSRSTAIACIAQLVGSEIGSADIELPQDVMISRDVLDWLPREAVFTGEAVAHISRMGGVFSLVPVADHDWQDSGNPDERTWRCRITAYAPSGSRTMIVDRSELVVLRWSWNAYSPGYGRSPAALAGTGSKAAARSESRQMDHATTPIRPLITMPETSETGGDEFQNLREKLAAGGGSPLLVETVAGGAGSRADAPMRDWNPSHLRPEPAAELNQLASDTFSRLVSSAGIPPGIFMPGTDGTALREGMRQARMRCVLPMARKLEDEFRMQLDDSIRIMLDPYPMDMQGRAAAVQKLTAAGVDVAVAMDALGIS